MSSTHASPRCGRSCCHSSAPAGSARLRTGHPGRRSARAREAAMNRARPGDEAGRMGQVARPRARAGRRAAQCGVDRQCRVCGRGVGRVLVRTGRHAGPSRGGAAAGGGGHPAAAAVQSARRHARRRRRAEDQHRRHLQRSAGSGGRRHHPGRSRLRDSRGARRAALGWSAAVAAVFTAYIRVLGGSLGAVQHFIGPMAKQHRMFTLTVGTLLAAVEVSAGMPPRALRVALRLSSPDRS